MDNFRYHYSFRHEQKKADHEYFFNLLPNPRKVQSIVNNSFLRPSESIDTIFEIINKLPDQVIPQALVNQLSFLFQHIRSPHKIFNNANCALFLNDEDRKIELTLRSYRFGEQIVSIYFDDENSNEYTVFLRYIIAGKLKILNGSVVDIAHHISHLYE